MKKSFVFIIALLLLTGCVQHQENINESEVLNEEEKSFVSFDDMSIEDMILNYLDGDWVDYYDSTHQFTYVVKSIDEIYSCIISYIPKEDFFKCIEDGEWDKENYVIEKQSFNIDMNNGWIFKYSFDTSKVEDGDINDIILQEDAYFNGDLKYENIYVRPGKEYIQPDPEIGMSYEEVKASTWGEPNDINKTTYEWGTTEQWCYFNSKYIYFENGVVTAIQE